MASPDGRSSRGPLSTSRAAARDGVLKAARRCFLEHGLRKTTMSDVAAAAGVTRQAVYKLFLGRRELVEAAIGERVAEIADELAATRWDEDDLVESFISVSVAVIENLRKDSELGVLLGDGTPTTLHDALWTHPVIHRGLSFWAPWLRRARKRGMLRGDVSDQELSDWLQTVYTSMVLRHDLVGTEERAMVERFVLASLGVASTSEPLPTRDRPAAPG